MTEKEDIPSLLANFASFSSNQARRFRKWMTLTFGGSLTVKGGSRSFPPFVFALIILNYSIILHLSFFGFWLLCIAVFILGTRAACFPLSLLLLFLLFSLFPLSSLWNFYSFIISKLKMQRRRRRGGGWKRSGWSRQINQGCLEYICTEQQDLNKLPRRSKFRQLQISPMRLGLMV